jgi:MFS family permease
LTEPVRTATRDRWLIYVAAFLRALAIGAAGVFVAIYLAERGFSLGAIGVIIGAGMIGNALTTLAVAARLDLRIGRTTLLVILGALGAVGYAVLALPLPLVALAPLAALGTMNGMGRDRGGLSALEQAVLPDTTDAKGRTWVLAWYNLVLDTGHAMGALGGAVPAVLVSQWHLSSLDAHRTTLLLCAIAMGIGSLLYAYLSVERQARRAKAPLPDSPARAPVSAGSRRAITRLAALFGLDSLGGGFLSSALIAYWFFERYGLAEHEIALLFFAARALNALSHLGAAWLARRIGLVNTMVWTHLPSSLFLIAAPAAPTAGLASTLFLAREGLVEMDVPTRQSYVLAIVRPEERTYASGVTNLARNLGWAAGPLVAGAIMQHVAIAGPLVIGGALKIAYDLMLYAGFRKLKPPEEP